jgi:hypothetical protein
MTSAIQPVSTPSVIITPEHTAEEAAPEMVATPANKETIPSMLPVAIQPEELTAESTAGTEASEMGSAAAVVILDVDMNEPERTETIALPLLDEESEQTAIVGHTREENADSYITDASAETPNRDDGDANTEQEIASAIQQGNFAEAYYLWRPRAEAGDAGAQYGIGWMYHNGYGLAINDDEAIAWWERASRQGHIDATFALGMLHGLGEGEVIRDMALAVSYYYRAAREGHEDARLLLRILMAEGDSNATQLMLTLFDEGRLEEITTPTTVISAKANVRKGPGTDHNVRTTLLQGNKLLPLKREGRWLLVGIEGKDFTGWIHDSLVEKDVLAN